MKNQIKNILLDLDNTCISAETVEDFPFERADIQRKAQKLAFYDMDGYYIIFERPYLQEFLDHLFKNYRVGVWTAASKDYALFIVEQILLKKPGRELEFILFSYHCDLSRDIYNDEGQQKNLKLLAEVLKIEGFDHKNTLLIDDLPENWDFQQDCVIRIHPFEILEEKSDKDQELRKLMQYL